MKRLIIAAMLLCLLLPSAVAGAATNPLNAACTAQGGVGASSAACDKGSNKGTDPISGPNGVLEKTTIILGAVGSIAAVIIIIIAGLSIVTSDGDSNQVAKARSAIIGALVGLLLILVAASIVAYVVNKAG